MPKRKFVSYLRVSTARQGISGLGLEAQRASVAGYLNGGDWTLVQEVLEVESGKRNDRPALAEALKLCRKHKATLVIAKLDRLARNVAFISNLMESGVEFIAVDMPQANRFVVHIMAAVAEQEADAISKRTKAALQAAKERGTKLGGRRMSAKRFAEIAANARKERTARVPKFQDSVFALSRRHSLGLHGIAGRQRFNSYQDRDSRIITTLQWTEIAPRHIGYKDILQAIMHKDFPSQQPRTADYIYLINRTRNIVLHMYDDRGMDLIAHEASDLQPIYDAYKGWILDYDRARIEQTFEPQSDNGVSV
jgi:DNA invertase Pin-like site-specific DNA recombinase